ncbi:transposase [Piscirickettsia salmonis]|uniref:transposase n=1 Tax=Piscirickettsia salmonis TaxID=1238 RepID=UPI0037516373
MARSECGSTMGWFYGFKLHLTVNDMGELMAFKLSQATTDDRVVLPEIGHCCKKFRFE